MNTAWPIKKSGLRGSNPSNWLGKPGHYHYAKPARASLIVAHSLWGLLFRDSGGAMSNRFIVALHTCRPALCACRWVRSGCAPSRSASGNSSERSGAGTGQIRWDSGPDDRDSGRD